MPLYKIFDSNAAARLLCHWWW
nr:unnamed protein product [Callosobruchus chinensis]